MLTKSLQLKFPTHSNLRGILASAVMVAALVYGFLAVFQPFGTYTFTHERKYLLLAPYAFIAFSVFFLGDFLISKYRSKWTWKNEIFKTVFFLFVCSVFNYVYNIYFVNGTDFSFRAFGYMVAFTWALGIPICSISVLAKYAFSANREPETDVTEFERAGAAEAESMLSIVPDVGEQVDIPKGDFLFAQSEGNYSVICFVKDEVAQKKILRIPLKKLEAQICDEAIFRCHRSYILNSRKAIGKKGNAQGLKIALEHSPKIIPVSRKYIEKMRY